MITFHCHFRLRCLVNDQLFTNQIEFSVTNWFYSFVLVFDGWLVEKLSHDNENTAKDQQASDCVKRIVFIYRLYFCLYIQFILSSDSVLVYHQFFSKSFLVFETLLFYWWNCFRQYSNLPVINCLEAQRSMLNQLSPTIGNDKIKMDRWQVNRSNLSLNFLLYSLI